MPVQSLGRHDSSPAVQKDSERDLLDPLSMRRFSVVSENGRNVLLLVNDRGPYVDGWILDLSHAAATALNHPGVGVVTAQVLMP